MYRIIDKIKANRVSSQCLYTYNVHIVDFQMFYADDYLSTCVIFYFLRYI